MNLFETVGSGISKAVDYVVEKNHRAALVNRLRIVIKNEREASSRAYVALGKYYFENLREPQNAETERLCRSVEESRERMDRVFEKLESLGNGGDDSVVCEDCAEDCGYCPRYEEEGVGAVEEEMDFSFLNEDESVSGGEGPDQKLAEKKAEEAAAAILAQAPADPADEELDAAFSVEVKEDGEAAEDEV